jgi:hypothetical protein
LRLHSETFPPKENHNVGLLRFDDDHDHICYRFAQVQIFGGKSNVFKSLQGVTKISTLILTSNRTRHDKQFFYVPFFPNRQFCLAFPPPPPIN